ncbi:MAG: sugar phosphate isomerase/epimerase [Ruminococcaceae bacterium]|nr:sugar phosphate isomerase/epimerase [Oscillospiraceae bacterium]
MKKGISIWSFPAQPLEETFKQAKKAGYDGVELSLEATGEITMDSTKEDILKIKASAEKHGIELYSVATSLHWNYSLTSANKEISDKAKEVIKKQLDIANWLGCDTILVVPGAVGVDFIPNCEIVDYDVAYERAFEGIKELSKYAEEKKVAIALENVGNKLLISPLEMRDFIDKIGSDYVGMYFDVGNIIRIGYPDQWIRILGNRIKKIHFKDFKRASNSFVDLMEGNVDFPAVMKALKSIGYDNWVTAEMGPLYINYPDMILYTTSMVMDRILEENR